MRFGGHPLGFFLSKQFKWFGSPLGAEVTFVPQQVTWYLLSEEVFSFFAFILVVISSDGSRRCRRTVVITHENTQELQGGQSHSGDFWSI